jgi:hypothetical protein
MSKAKMSVHVDFGAGEDKSLFGVVLRDEDGEVIPEMTPDVASMSDAEQQAMLLSMMGPLVHFKGVLLVDEQAAAQICANAESVIQELDAFRLAELNAPEKPDLSDPRLIQWIEHTENALSAAMSAGTATPSHVNDILACAREYTAVMANKPLFGPIATLESTARREAAEQKAQQALEAAERMQSMQMQVVHLPNKFQKTKAQIIEARNKPVPKSNTFMDIQAKYDLAVANLKLGGADLLVTVLVGNSLLDKLNKLIINKLII